MLYLTGILSGYIAVNAEKNEEIGEHSMAVIDMFCNAPACVRQAYMIIAVNGNESLILHLLEDYGNRRA